MEVWIWVVIGIFVYAALHFGYEAWAEKQRRKQLEQGVYIRVSKPTNFGDGIEYVGPFGSVDELSLWYNNIDWVKDGVKFKLVEVR